MPKIGALKKTTAKKKTPAKKGAAPKKAAAKSFKPPDGATMSDEEDDEDQEVINILGKIGAGKTFVAASFSEFFPKSGKLPASRVTTLEDMFWIELDAKPVAGFKHNKLRVPRFSVPKYMAEHGCDIVVALNEGMNVAANSDALWIVVDTVTSLDMKLLALNRRLAAGSANAWEAYKLNLASHATIYDALIGIGTNLLFCFHSRMYHADQDEKGQNKGIAVSTALGGEIIPDLTGQAGKIYKRDSTMQLYIKAYYDPRTKGTKRELFIGHNSEGSEAKNRYEGLLPSKQSPPHGYKLLEEIWKS